MLVIVAVAIIIVMKKQNRDPDKGEYITSIHFLKIYFIYRSCVKISELNDTLIKYCKHNCCLYKKIIIFFKYKKNLQ